MKRKTSSADEPHGRLRAVKDELPPPRELIPREDSVVVSVSLSREAAEFYRLGAAKAGLPMHRFIRRWLETRATAGDAILIPIN